MGALQEAHAAVAQHSFDQPKEQAESAGQETQSQDTPDWTNNQEETKETALSDENKQVLEEILELDKHERFRFQGKDWTLEELQRSVMFQNDYTRKSQETAKMREFALNAYYDIEKVRENPALAAEFKRIYPKEFHSHVDEALTRMGRAKEQSQANKQESVKVEKQESLNIPPELMQRLDRVEMSLKQKEEEIFQANVETYKKEVDQICDSMSKKYKFADMDAVLSGAASLSNQGHKLNEKAWETLFKNSNEFHEKRFTAYQKEMFNKQKTASGKARDMGTGGQIAGSPPKKLSMSEAREAMIAHIDANSGRS